jgi:hypothetical protein
VVSIDGRWGHEEGECCEGGRTRIAAAAVQEVGTGDGGGGGEQEYRRRTSARVTTGLRVGNRFFVPLTGGPGENKRSARSNVRAVVPF